MRITIGHVLMTGVAGFTAFQFFFSPSSSMNHMKSGNPLAAEIQSWVSLFRSGESTTIASKPEDAPPIQTSSPVSDTVPSLSDNKVTVTASAIAEPAKESVVKNDEIVKPIQAAASVPITAPVVQVKQIQKAPVVRPVVRRRAVNFRRKAVTPTATGVGTEKRLAAVAPPKMSMDKMIGAYVSVELFSGKKIMGILQEKNAKEIKIQLPGMGPFTYEASSVKSIQPAE